MGRVDEKVALISGGARGMVPSTARALVAEGAKVVDRRHPRRRRQGLADEIGDAARYVHLDVTAAEEWDAAVAVAVNEFGKLNVLVKQRRHRRSRSDRQVSTWRSGRKSSTST